MLEKAELLVTTTSAVLESSVATEDKLETFSVSEVKLDTSLDTPSEAFISDESDANVRTVRADEDQGPAEDLERADVRVPELAMVLFQYTDVKAEGSSTVLCTAAVLVKLDSLARSNDFDE